MVGPLGASRLPTASLCGRFPGRRQSVSVRRQNRGPSPTSVHEFFAPLLCWPRPWTERDLSDLPGAVDDHDDDPHWKPHAAGEKRENKMDALIGPAVVDDDGRCLRDELLGDDDRLLS